MIQLHLHTEYSMLDSIIKIPELLAEVKSRGDKAVAITDHGTLGGWIEFYKECKKAKVKPIFGVEFYHSLTKESKENYHITLLAKNKKGFENIIKLNNLSNDNFYKKPRVTTEMLINNGEGIIGLSGCMQGYLAQAVLDYGFDWNFYNRIESALDGFYLEVQDSGVEEQKYIYEEFCKTKLPMVATIDCHYLKKQDAFAHEVSLGIMINRKLGDPKAFRFSTNEYYLKTRDEMLNLFDEKIVDVSDIIASEVEVFEIGYSDWNLPHFEIDKDKELSELEFVLEDYIFDNIKEDEQQEYRDRLSYEFKVIVENDFLTYFVIIADLCKHFDDNDMFRGWGRGSASGSLVSFLYGITKIDPVRWGLYFERFLNPDRISPPDIDLDFQPEHKAVAIEYLKNKYGEVYQIGNYGTLATTEVIKSVSRIMNYQTDLNKYVPVMTPIPTIKQLLETNDTFIEHADKEDEKFISVLLKLEGLKKNFSTHAAGIVIDKGLPLRVSRSGKNAGLPITVWDMYALESMRYVKFDILGVNALSIVDRTCKKVRIKVKDIPLEDEKTLKLIQDRKTVGVFQMESEGYKKILNDLHPDNFDELIDLNTLCRPGGTESGLTEQYINRKHGREEVIQLHPSLKMKTQGLPIFQEDIMEMAKVLAGFSLSDADRLRRAIGKKKKDEFKILQEMWIEECKKNNIDEKQALDFWAIIEKYSRYTFNKAHSVAYTYVSWWTAYLSANYPVYFLCELINGASSIDKRRVIFSECRQRGIEILHPDINKSGRQSKVLDGKILMGLSGIKYVGGKTLDSIIKAQEYGEFKNISDLKTRTKINKRHIEYLSKAGAFGVTPSLEDEKEALGYNIGDRVIDRVWWSKYCNELGEVIDVNVISTKKGDPMCFLQVEYKDRIGSVTVFPRDYDNHKHILIKGYVGLFSINDRGVLVDYSNIDESKLGVYVLDSEGFMSFNSSIIDLQNIYDKNGFGIASVDIDDTMLKFIDTNFGINKIILNR